MKPQSSDNALRPMVGITLGDPAGIGPEVVAKALAQQRVYRACRPLVIGHEAVLERACASCGLPLSFNVIDAPSDGRYQLGEIDLLQPAQVELREPVPGKVDGRAGRVAYACIERAVQLALAQQIDAIATAPINKQSLRAGGIAHIGHTEILAALTACDDPLTLFEVQGLRIFFLTRHVPLRRACELISQDRVLQQIVRCCDALGQLGIDEGILAVAALNPHASDDGLIGQEETEQILPAIEAARRAGHAVHGPFAADSVFHLARQGRYAAVLSLYHDQGHIAAKTMDYERTIAITLGLPFLRTSVDHGTAFDIAGTGRASATSMVEAIVAAARYGPRSRACI